MFGLVACVVVGLCVLHCLWRPIRFVVFTGLGIVAIVGGIRMLAHEAEPILVVHEQRAVAEEAPRAREHWAGPRVSIDPGIRIERTESIVPKITVDPQIDVDHDARPRAFPWWVDSEDAEGPAPFAASPSWAKIVLAAVLLIVGWMLVGGGTGGRALKVMTVLGMVVGGVVLVSLFVMPKHAPSLRNRDIVVRNGDVQRAPAAVPKAITEPERSRVAKRPTRAKRPASRAERDVTSEELLAQMPKRAGEIPVEKELAKTSEQPRAQAPQAAATPQSASEPAAPAEREVPAPAPPAEVAAQQDTAPAESPVAQPEPAAPAADTAQPQPPAESASPDAAPAPATPPPVAASNPEPAAPSTTEGATLPPALPTSAPQATAAVPVAATPTATTATPADRPNWIDMPGRLDDTVYRVSVKSGPWVSVPECQRAVEAAIKHETDQYIDELLGEPGASKLVNISRGYLREHVKKAEYNEVMQASVGPMHQIHALLEFDDNARATFHERWRAAVVSERLVYAGTAAAAVLALLGTFYGYLRLDLRTGGAHKGRLQLAATLVALIVAATALLVRWVE